MRTDISAASKPSGRRCTTGYWRLEDARVYAGASPARPRKSYDLKTNLTRAQVQETFATPETVPFWQLLSSLIRLAENSGLAAVGYRLQYYQLLVLPLYLVAMVLLAAAVSLRLFRFGGVQTDGPGWRRSGLSALRIVESGGGFEQGQPADPRRGCGVASVWAAVTGFVALLYQEDG